MKRTRSNESIGEHKKAKSSEEYRDQSPPTEITYGGDLIGNELKSESGFVEPVEPVVAGSETQTVTPKSAEIEDGNKSTDDIAPASQSRESTESVESSETISKDNLEASQIDGQEQTIDNNKELAENKIAAENETKEATKSDNKVDSEAASKPTVSGFSSFSKGFGGFGGFGGPSKLQTSSTKTNPWAESAEKTSEVVEETKKPESQESSEKEGSFTPAEDSDVYAKVTLSKQDIKTGEEHETCIHQVRVRLYAVDLDSEDKTWKERGVGVLKLNETKPNQADEDGKSRFRLVLRAENVLRVSLNLLLVPKMQVSKGFQSSLHTDKFVRLAGIEDGKAYQFAMKCATTAARDELFDAINNTLN